MFNLFLLLWTAVMLKLASDWLVKMYSATSALSSWMFWMKRAISMAPRTCLLMVDTLDEYPMRVFMVTPFWMTRAVIGMSGNTSMWRMKNFCPLGVVGLIL